MADITQILLQIEWGDSSAAGELLPLVYEELRKLAASRLGQEKSGQTLGATDLVHEAYVRLVDTEKTAHWNSRGHFFGAAAEAMRRILVDRARNKRRLKRGGNRRQVDLNAIEIALDTPAEELLGLHEALDGLAVEYPDCAELVQLRFFAGLSLGESAAALGISRRTAERKWAFARAWLHQKLQIFDALS